MNKVQLYKNPKYYPHYTHNITKYGPELMATPRNMDLKTGYIDLQVTFADVMACNYLSYERDGLTVYAWITNVEERGGNRLFRFFYEVDPLRTYLSKLDLGNQFIIRSPEPTEIFDPFLGSTQAYSEITRTEYTLGNPTKRVLVLQVKRGPSDAVSNVPVNPSPHNFLVKEYNVDAWPSDSTIYNLMIAMAGEKPDNIITMYSVPYFDTSNLGNVVFTVNGVGVSGFKIIGTTTPTKNLITTKTNITIPADLTKVAHSVMIVIPEAGVMNIPDELLYVDGLALRQDVDIFSGACNYMLVDGNNKPYHLSVRGSSISSIPIVGDPFETYLSQNQNTLAVSMLGDVANVVTGGAMMLTGGGVAGTGLLTKGISSLAGTFSNVLDAGRVQTNPPAYLGTALAPNFNQKFWLIVVKAKVTNESIVHAELGYPCNIFKPLALPASGYIQTQGCAVKTDGTVPLWAVQEINTIFDNGIKVE